MQKEKPLVISLFGEYDVLKTNDLESALAPSYRFPYVIVDFSEVPYLDSSALTVMIGVRKLRAEMGFPPKRFINVPPVVRRILEITALTTVWQIYDTLEDAVASFSKA